MSAARRPVPPVITIGHCPRCYAYVRGRLIQTVDERRELVDHDDCPGEPPRGVRARTYNG
ncbi:hypothetical protein ACFWXO_39430 [Kitasatospora sp. NPDC059088]|uniref:hypothetical protein n=1 Tax=Kitasatospora sp. NPDC059088 TaxID=3346722 RepID=UPI003673801B